MKKNRVLYLLFACALLLGTIFTSTTQYVSAASYESSISTDAKYVIYNANSGKCLQPYNLSSSNATAIVQGDYTGSEAQQWTFVEAGNGYYYLENVGNGKVMDITGKSKDDCAANIIYPNKGQTNQQFELISYNGYYKIMNRNSGKVLDILNFSTADNAACIQYTDNNTSNQLFSLVEVSSSDDSDNDDSSDSSMRQLSQDEIVSEMGAGWNLGNSLEANMNQIPDETVWGNPTVTKELITAVKDAGFDTIRIPVSYLNYIGSAPDYTIDSNWLARVQEVVDYAYSQGLYVILNVHGDGYHSVSGGWLLCDESDQTTIQAKYTKVWEQLADTFKDYDERLIFESMNEVFDGTYGTPNTTYYNNINTYNQLFVDTVRQSGGNNSSRWLLVPGWNTDITYTAGDYGFVIPSDDYISSDVPSDEKRIMISVHYYSPWDFCGEENMNITQWGASATNSSSTSTWGQEDFLYSQFYSLYYKFTSQGYPVVIGEFGSIDKGNESYRAAYAYTVANASKQYGCVPVVWDNGYNGTYGFGLFDRSNCTVTQQSIINAIMSGLQ